MSALSTALQHQSDSPSSCLRYFITRIANARNLTSDTTGRLQEASAPQAVCAPPSSTPPTAAVVPQPQPLSQISFSLPPEHTSPSLGVTLTLPRLSLRAAAWEKDAGSSVDYTAAQSTHLVTAGVKTRNTQKTRDT
eukprot:CAMPEP_0181345152 /NCGR_PEP_ID=MMETSP1101-20121128/32594_1 /TAXON_ID=46948 /ORGANISM="Rhodomonas abbreviata, Strain Caron Lab Isolate" /LENGTH=135 /DNA_ID=CAMNT_0023457083 /DNA_START=350 /DNA_END=754 /DNA_ORIENTATION=-